MRTAAKGFLAILFGVFVFNSANVFVLGAGSARTINLPNAEASYTFDDDEEPEIKTRVARISFIRGEARIRRVGSDEWEKVTLNLPITEGDEITTDPGTRLEIQLDKNGHLRLAENAYLKFVGLKDEGIAVSLSLGSMNLRFTSFDKDKSFFEIDAPKTTLAIQRSGAYRIDAGKIGDNEIRVGATEGGEARVYSDSAGFTVKSGRSARIYIEGSTAGEWETAEASRFNDDFDSWSSDRDEVIARRLKDAHYDKYYDSDIYGADDLNDHGAWVHTTNYGYVWRPHRASLIQYADWSPYRFGHWRWVPPYGWAWVNDEPWGWATYHHGRWFFDAGHWNWSPYGYYRHRRSWWSPALVVISIFSNSVCWYPTPYYRRHYDYNSHYRRPRGPLVTPPLPGQQVNPRETAGIMGRVKGVGRGATGRGGRVDDIVPPGGVVTIASNDFGKRTGGIRTAPPGVAKTILMKRSDDTGEISQLPDRSNRGRKVNSDFDAERPKVDPAVVQARVGASKRNADAPLDEELRTTRIFGGRPPQKIAVEPVTTDRTVSEPRKTGAVERKSIVRMTDTEPREIRQQPKRIETQPEGETPRSVRASPKEMPRGETPETVVQPRREMPDRKPVERPTSPPVKESPRYDPPARQPRETPAPQQKSEPKPESKPAPPAASRKKDPDGES
jgi:hypothetical protein